MYRTIVEAVLAHGMERSDRLAIGYKDTRITYGELCRQIRRSAAILKEEYQIRHGDKIMLSAVSKPEYVVILLALQYLGAVTVPADKAALEKNIVDVYNFNGADLIFTDTKITDPSIRKHSLSALYKRICGEQFGADEYDTSEYTDPSQTASGKSTDQVQVPSSEHIIPAPAERSDEEIAEILFTTGTTGRPKGAMLSIGNIYASTHNTREGVGMLESDVILIPLPLNHSVGMRVLRTALYTGASVVIQNGFAFPKELRTNISAFACTGFVCVPAVLERLYRQMGDAFVPALQPLRYMEIGAGSLSLDMKKKITGLFPDMKIFNTWGSTETGGAIFLEVSACPHKLASLGKPVSGVELKVVDADGRPVQARDIDTAGRMALRGPMQMKGYYHLQKETEDALRDGWLFTNDLVYTDEDGFVYMLGRADDIINVGGEKVSPLEVENIASEFPGIAECACMGVEDPEQILGQIPLLCYVPEEQASLDEKEIVTFLSERMENWKLPKLFFRMGELPRNRTQKLDRKRLRAIWEESGGEQLTNEVVETILARRSVRKFQNRPIPRPVLEQLLRCGVQAPTANNMQTWRFTVLQNRDSIEQLKAAIAETAAEKTVKFYGMENPAAVVIITNDRRNANGLIDASLAAGNIMLAAQSFGLGSVWNNALRKICEEPKVRELLSSYGIGARQTVCAMLCLGYPAETPKKIERRQDIFTWI